MLGALIGGLNADGAGVVEVDCIAGIACVADGIVCIDDASGGAAGVSGFCVKSIGGFTDSSETTGLDSCWGALGIAVDGVGGTLDDGVVAVAADDVGAFDDGIFCIDAGLGTEDGDGAIIVERGVVDDIVEVKDGIDGFGDDGVGVGGLGGNTCCDVGGCGLGRDDETEDDPKFEGAVAVDCAAVGETEVDIERGVETPAGFGTAETTCSEMPNVTGFIGVGVDVFDAGGWVGVPVMDVT